jgi:hypothetical protein
MLTIVACAGKQRYGNREKFEVTFQFQERQKKEFEKKEGRHKRQKERFRGKTKWAKHRYKGRKERNITKGTDKGWMRQKEEYRSR